MPLFSLCLPVFPLQLVLIPYMCQDCAILVDCNAPAPSKVWLRCGWHCDNLVMGRCRYGYGFKFATPVQHHTLIGQVYGYWKHYSRVSCHRVTACTGSGPAQMEAKVVDHNCEKTGERDSDSAAASLYTKTALSAMFAKSYDTGQKGQFIEIWLDHIKVSKLSSTSHLLLMPCNLGSKSSAKSSRSSLQTLVSTSSFASAVKLSTKALQCGVKCSIANGSKAIIQPLKCAKHVASNATSTPVESKQEAEQALTMDDHMSISSNGTTGDAIKIESDNEELEKDLHMSFHYCFLPLLLTWTLEDAKKSWWSPIYTFFKPDVSIQIHKNRLSHFFTCLSKHCRTGLKGVRRYHDKGDKFSTANLKHHIIRCFGEDTVNAAMK